MFQLVYKTTILEIHSIINDNNNLAVHTSLSGLTKLPNQEKAKNSFVTKYFLYAYSNYF